jgi:hypothetical protein
MAADALVTAQNWGLGDKYTVDSLKQMFELVK